MLLLLWLPSPPIYVSMQISLGLDKAMRLSHTDPQCYERVWREPLYQQHDCKNSREKSQSPPVEKAWT
jgi:hypothetical protein